MGHAFWNVCKSTRAQLTPLPVEVNTDGPFDDIQEALGLRRSQFTARIEFCGVLGECRAQGWPRMHYGCTAFHPGKRGPHKSVRGQEYVITMLRASGLPETR